MPSSGSHFGLIGHLPPDADKARQAADSLRGYIYQALSTALAWLDIGEDSHIYIEVAEDFATIARNAINAVQVKDTKASSITLRSTSVRDAIHSLLDLSERNPKFKVQLFFLTTSAIGLERRTIDRPAGMAGLEYWKKAAAGADLQPLRSVLEGEVFSKEIRAFCNARDDQQLRSELIQRLHWQCDQPDASILRQELAARLIVIGRERFQIPSFDSVQLTDHVIYHVLKQSTASRVQDRILTKSALYELIDSVTNITIPRKFVTSMLATISSYHGSYSQQPIRAIDPNHNWIVNGASLSSLPTVVARSNIESHAEKALKRYGLAVITGSSGTGKSFVCRILATKFSSPFWIVYLRNANAEETRLRLDMLFSHIGHVDDFSTLILDDMVHLENPIVLPSLLTVLSAAHRRNMRILITCHRTPTLSALANLRIETTGVVGCSYFTLEETFDLVSSHGGDPTVWGHVAHMAGALGHPQLTHTFVVGMEQRGWKHSEPSSGVAMSYFTGDVQAARDEARRALLSELPTGTRELLYRLSLVVGQFDRLLALEVAEVPPRIIQAGEALDGLIGPWVEIVAEHQFTISPLIAQSGDQMLPANQQVAVHRSVATARLQEGVVKAADIDSILFHALRGQSDSILATLAHAILSSGEEDLEAISRHALSFRLLKTSAPITHENKLVAILLRLVQLLLLMRDPNPVTEQIDCVCETLFIELEEIQEKDGKESLEAMILAKVLNTVGAADHLTNWFNMLHRIDQLLNTNKELQSTIDLAYQFGDTGDVLGAMFIIGSARLSDIGRLVHIIEQINVADSGLRDRLLNVLYTTPGGCAAFINAPWIAMRNRDQFDVKRVADRYRHIATVASTWPGHLVAVHAAVAQAVLLDEIAGDRHEAEGALRQAKELLGEQARLKEAQASIFLNHGEYQEALTVYRAIAEEVSRDDATERGYTLRRGAIAAGRCGDWQTAAQWFSEARVSFEALQTTDAKVITLGLEVDTAVAEFEAGNRTRAIDQLIAVAAKVSGINPEETLQAAYCHHVFRHTVLWLKACIGSIDVKIEGLPISIVPGSCSNPDPSQIFATRELGHLDVAWYMLAELKISVGDVSGAQELVPGRLAKGVIPSLEIQFRAHAIDKAIEELDAKMFSYWLIPYISARLYLTENYELLKQEFSVLDPKSGDIANIDIEADENPNVVEFFKNTLLAFGLQSIFCDCVSKVYVLKSVLEDEFTLPISWQGAFKDLEQGPTEKEDLAAVVMDLAGGYMRNEPIDVETFWISSLRFFEWISQSYHKNTLLPHLAKWMHKGWERVIAKQRFGLRTPMVTVPAIEDVLSSAAQPENFVARMLLATSSAVGTRLGSDYRARLEAITRDSAN